MEQSLGQTGEIVMYQPDETIRLEVRMDNETVWLNRQQMASLFDRDVKTIGKHINNALKEELRDLATVAKFAIVQPEGKRMISRLVEFYNLDMVLSVGYRVKSQKGILFRQWANQILKDYLLRGYAVNKRMEQLEQRVTKTEEKIDFFVRTSLPPVEGIFFDGQIFDAYRFVSDLIRKAKRSVVLIDNYVDDTVLSLLDKRQEGVTAIVYTKSVSEQLQLDITRHNEQYATIEVRLFNKAHDRFLLIDDEVYHILDSLSAQIEVPKEFDENKYVLVSFFENVTIKTSEAAEMAVTSDDSKVQFVGTYAPVMLTGNNTANLYMGTDDKIHIPTEHSEVGAFNGYFLLDLGSGTITLDGHSLTEWDTQWLREHVGLVMQKNHIFDGSIEENIKYGNPQATHEEVVEAARKASLYEQVMAMPDGFESNALRLSGGQQQRVAIARMFIKTPSIIILDEPTASLDAIATEQIKSSIDAIKQGRTVIIISHNIGQIVDADYLYLLEQGRVVEQGTPADVYRQGGRYKEIFDASARSMNADRIADVMEQ